MLSVIILTNVTETRFYSIKYHFLISFLFNSIQKTDFLPLIFFCFLNKFILKLYSRMNCNIVTAHSIASQTQTSIGVYDKIGIFTTDILSALCET